MDIEEWLAELPTGGLAMISNLVSIDPQGRKVLVQSMRLDPSIPCDQSAETIRPSDIGTILTSGQAGVAGIADNEGAPLSIDSEGNVVKYFSGGETIHLGYQVPASFRMGLTKPFFGVAANNSAILVVGLRDSSRKDAPGQLIALRKSDGTWHRVPDVSPDHPAVRVFGSFLAIPEAHLKTSDADISLGQNEWRTKKGKMGPSIAESFSETRFKYMGRLHVYDLLTQKLYTIETGQGDSEVLLIDGATVYYRASDRLYSAQITATGLSPSELMAKDEAIRDAHWAFVRH